jgi:hypothetical protein
MPTALNNTLTKLASVTLGSGQTTISFTAIPQTYTDLVVKFSINSASNNQYIRFNNSSAAIYQLNTLRGTGSAADNYVSSANQTELYFMASGIAANTFGSAELYIANYTSAIFKSCFLNAVGEANTATVYSNQIASSWNSTSAINQIDIVCASGLGQYSSATLYGVNPVKTQALATGGDIVTNDGTYWYHAFLASGTFTPTITLSCDVLLVAGGGGGAGQGGGGAGGVLFNAAQSFSSAKTITIGAGGAGWPTNSNGTSTSVTGLTSPTGGGKGSNAASLAGTGGSGGGGAGNSTYQAGAAGTAGQGFAGGNGQVEGSIYGAVGGGGGGAGSAGGNASNAIPAISGGAGGQGTSAYSSWGLATGTGQNVAGTVYFAGGGGGYTGGRGGLGGGGGGAGNGYSGNGEVGFVNTGGGGGAFGGGTNNGGGSGIVIIRYAMA